MEHRGSRSRERSNSGGGSYGDRDYSELYSLKDVFSDEYYTKNFEYDPSPHFDGKNWNRDNYEL